MRGEADIFEKFFCPFFVLGCDFSGDARWHEDVVEGREIVKEVGALEDKADGGVAEFVVRAMESVYAGNF